jgi:streptogramin lyase
VTITGSSNGTSGSSLSQLNAPFGISITQNDVLYISDSYNHRIVVIHLNYSINISLIGSGPGSNLNQYNVPYGLSITNTSLYVIDENNHRVQKTSLDGSNPSTVPGLSGLNWPYYLYVDNNDNIYVSSTGSGSVLLFLSNSTSSSIVAGTGVLGSNNHQLNQPYGIFVNQNGTIFIADYNNHRIMKWFSGASFGILVAGGTSGPGSTQLYLPTQIIVDTNEYMYISEAGNSRITRWAPNSIFGVCIAACAGTTGTASTQLNAPHSLAFDSHGSLYVSDRANNRVQKFQILRYQGTFSINLQSQ